MSDCFCNAMDCSPPSSSVHGIFQARILEWVAISFSRGSSWLRDWTQVSWKILYHWPISEYIYIYIYTHTHTHIHTHTHNWILYIYINYIVLLPEGSDIGTKNRHSRKNTQTCTEVPGTERWTELKIRMSELVTCTFFK